MEIKKTNKVAVGDILVTPAYGYTNRVPEIVRLSFVAIYGEEDITWS